MKLLNLELKTLLKIIDEYNKGAATVDLAKKYKIKPRTMRYFLRKRPEVNWRGRRTYSLNETFFEEINTPEKAYVFGFICAWR